MDNDSQVVKGGTVLVDCPSRRKLIIEKEAPRQSLRREILQKALTSEIEYAEGPAVIILVARVPQEASSGSPGVGCLVVMLL